MCLEAWCTGRTRFICWFCSRVWLLTWMVSMQGTWAFIWIISYGAQILFYICFRMIESLISSSMKFCSIWNMASSLLFSTNRCSSFYSKNTRLQCVGSWQSREVECIKSLISWSWWQSGGHRTRNQESINEFLNEVGKILHRRYYRKPAAENREKKLEDALANAYCKAFFCSWYFFSFESNINKDSSKYMRKQNIAHK